MWHAVERGEGAPLVLLHGIGMARSAWNPVLGRLAGFRRVLAFDLPGFGRTDPLPPHVEPTPAAIAEALVAELRGRGIEPPVDIVGNSLGGFVALEAAKAGYARSVVGLSPAGLWRETIPRWVRGQLGLVRFACRGAPRLARLGAQVTPLRALGLLGPVAWKGWRVPAEEAVEAVENFGQNVAYEAVVEAASPGFRGGQAIEIPVTVAFGERDFVLLQGAARFGDELPPHTKWLSLPGCGHVPMWDDPEAVTRTVLDGIGEDERVGSSD